MKGTLVFESAIAIIHCIQPSRLNFNTTAHCHIGETQHVMEHLFMNSFSLYIVIASYDYWNDSSM